MRLPLPLAGVDKCVRERTGRAAWHRRRKARKKGRGRFLSKGKEGSRSMSRSGAGVMGSAIPDPVPCNLDDRQFQRWGGWWGGWEKSAKFRAKKQGAAGITTAAPYIAGQWGRGDNRLPG
jgi:hypothetical protein